MDSGSDSEEPRSRVLPSLCHNTATGTSPSWWLTEEVNTSQPYKLAPGNSLHTTLDPKYEAPCPGGGGGSGEQSILKLVRRLRRLSSKGFQPHAKGVPTSIISQAKMKIHN